MLKLAAFFLNKISSICIAKYDKLLKYLSRRTWTVKVFIRTLHTHKHLTVRKLWNKSGRIKYHDVFDPVPPGGRGLVPRKLLHSEEHWNEHIGRESHFGTRDYVGVEFIITRIEMMDVHAAVISVVVDEVRFGARMRPVRGVGGATGEGIGGTVCTLMGGMLLDGVVQEIAWRREFRKRVGLGGALGGRRVVPMQALMDVLLDFFVVHVVTVPVGISREWMSFRRMSSVFMHIQAVRSSMDNFKRLGVIALLLLELVLVELLLLLEWVLPLALLVHALILLPKALHTLLTVGNGVQAGHGHILPGDLRQLTFQQVVLFAACIARFVWLYGISICILIFLSFQVLGVFSVFSKFENRPETFE